MPFGEYMPLRGLLEALGAPADQIGRDAMAGTGPGRLDTARRHEARRGDLVGGVLRRAGPRGRRGTAAEAILNPTNGSSYTGTMVQTQQVAS